MGDLAVHVGETEISAGKPISQFFMVQTQKMKYRGVQVAVHGLDEHFS